MPSMLPTGDAASKAVKDFGIGTYDSPSDQDPHGEDDEETSPRAVPDGGPDDRPDVELLIGYPQEQVIDGKHATLITEMANSILHYMGDMLAAEPSSLPGDYDRPTGDHRPEDDTFPDVLPTSGVPTTGKPEKPRKPGKSDSAQSQLPSGTDGPAARADYYDRMVRGKSVEEIWPEEDSGAYVSGDDSLPSPSTNDVSFDDFLNALGNAWSGFVVEDQSENRGFPSPDFLENTDFQKSNTDSLGGTVLANSDASNAGSTQDRHMNTRQATNLELVGDLTKEFLSVFGKKDLTRRHVLSFIQDRGLPTYLASDVVRCLKHRYKITIPDIMDIFPISRKASVDEKFLSDIHRRLVSLEAANIAVPELASVFRLGAARVARVIARLERVGS